MSMWYVKELSKVTKVSIRTLHYYDKIGLLKPSERLANGYRVYSENDLLKLEQIIALKFFGFTLSHIKILLHKNKDMLSFLKAQLNLLEAEVSHLQGTQKKLLVTAIEDLETHKTVNWNQIVRLIELYADTKAMKQAWARQAYLALTEDEPSTDDNNGDTDFKKRTRETEHTI